MQESTEVILRLIEQNYSQLRQHEDQRATITGLIIVIASAIQGGLTQTGFSKNALTLTTTLIILGLFGIVACTKLRERYVFHSRRLRKLFDCLDKLVPDIHIQEMSDLSSREHKAQYKILAIKFRREYLWTALHVLITVSGLAYTFIIIFK
jgi:hypothetical protein